MENELRIIAGLSPEQLVERAKALQLEVTYWQHVLDDAAKINDAVLVATRAVLEALAPAMVMLALAGPGQLELLETIVEQLRRTVEQLTAIGDANGATVDLAAGRKTSLEPVGDAVLRAAGVEPERDEPGGQS